MASSTYLELTNRVLNAMNEVELDSVSFSSTVGFYTEAKNAINQGLFDLYSYEGTKWPFLYGERDFTATRGVFKYTVPAGVIDIDWESFRILRQSYSISSITQTGGLATVTTSAPHNMITGDLVYIDNATQTGYNMANVGVIVTGASTFTYSVAASTVSPATGSITCLSNTILWTPLYPLDIHEYYNSYAKDMENMTSDNFQTPEGVVKDQKNNIIIFFPPDRIYPMAYDAFTIPTGLINYNDVHLVPEQYEQAIVDFGLHYAYMFRDNAEEAQLATKRAEDRVRRMRKTLMPVQPNVNWG